MFAFRVPPGGRKREARHEITPCSNGDRVRFFDSRIRLVPRARVLLPVFPLDVSRSNHVAARRVRSDPRAVLRRLLRGVRLHVPARRLGLQNPLDHRASRRRRAARPLRFHGNRTRRLRGIALRRRARLDGSRVRHLLAAHALGAVWKPVLLEANRAAGLSCVPAFGAAAFGARAAPPGSFRFSCDP